MWTEDDQKHARNALRSLKRATHNELLGVEVVALTLCMQWLEKLPERFEDGNKRISEREGLPETGTHTRRTKKNPRKGSGSKGKPGNRGMDISVQKG